jgi:hypothetical protein
MEERDPTDLGVPRPLTPAEREELVAAAAARKRELRRLEESGPNPSPPASERVIERAYAAAGFVRGRRSSSLLRRCRTCGAGPRSWCQGRFGYLHSERSEAASTPD